MTTDDATPVTPSTTSASSPLAIPKTSQHAVSPAMRRQVPTASPVGWGWVRAAQSDGVTCTAKATVSTARNPAVPPRTETVAIRASQATMASPNRGVAPRRDVRSTVSAPLVSATKAVGTTAVQ